MRVEVCFRKVKELVTFIDLSEIKEMNKTTSFICFCLRAYLELALVD